MLLGEQAVSGVEPSSQSVHVELRPDPSAPASARRFVAEHAGLADAAEALALLTSELVTNAVLHARTAMVLGVTVGTSRVLVTIADGDVGGTPQVQPPDDQRPSGRGILLVEAMAAQWGVFENDGGKTVWFTLPRDAAGTESATAS
jgi:two-component sensor histidine kinase